VTSFQDDTVLDKFIRFIIGAILGVVSAWFLAAQSGVQAIRSFATFVVVGALVTGSAAMVFGNAFIERFIRGRWWEDE
jgi:hypothetical protein